MTIVEKIYPTGVGKTHEEITNSRYIDKTIFLLPTKLSVDSAIDTALRIGLDKTHNIYHYTGVENYCILLNQQVRNTYIETDNKLIATATEKYPEEIDLLEEGITPEAVYIMCRTACPITQSYIQHRKQYRKDNRGKKIYIQRDLDREDSVNISTDRYIHNLHLLLDGHYIYEAIQCPRLHLEYRTVEGRNKGTRHVLHGRSILFTTHDSYTYIRSVVKRHLSTSTVRYVVDEYDRIIQPSKHYIYTRDSVKTLYKTLEEYGGDYIEKYLFTIELILHNMKNNPFSRILYEEASREGYTREIVKPQHIYNTLGDMGTSNIDLYALLKKNREEELKIQNYLRRHLPKVYILRRLSGNVYRLAKEHIYNMHRDIYSYVVKLFNYPLLDTSYTAEDYIYLSTYGDIVREVLQEDTVLLSATPIRWQYILATPQLYKSTLANTVGIWRGESIQYPSITTSLRQLLDSYMALDYEEVMSNYGYREIPYIQVESPETDAYIQNVKVYPANLGYIHSISDVKRYYDYARYILKANDIFIITQNMKTAEIFMRDPRFRDKTIYIRSQEARGITIDVESDRGKLVVYVAGTPYKPPTTIVDKIYDDPFTTSKLVSTVEIEGGIYRVMNTRLDIQQSINELIQAVGRITRHRYMSRRMYRIDIVVEQSLMHKLYIYSPSWFRKIMLGSI